MENERHCGYVAILGRPNVGKSTLLNSILRKKISITSDKPQTTRHQILGIKTQNNVQVVYVDTPGIHKQAKTAINRLMNRAAMTMIYDVDLIVFMIDAKKWTSEDELVLKLLQKATCPIILALNKVDLIKDKTRLLSIIESFSKKMSFAEIVPLSVKKNINVDALEKYINQHLPKQDYFFPEDQITDRDERFLVSEIVREKLMRMTGKEVPYGIAVTVESFEKKDNVLHVNVIIWVERKGQKIIVIGKKGEGLKEIGKQARLDLERHFRCKVFLGLWVKVKAGWTQDEKTLSKLGY